MHASSCTQATLPPAAALGRGSFAPARAAARLLDTLHLWQQRAATRRELLGLNPRMLKDIGLSRADAEREARKPFWQP